MLHALALKEIGKTADLAVLQSVHRHNPDALWTILRADDEVGTASIAGLHAYLHLNRAGYAALEAGTLDACAPALAFLAGAGERPAAIYVWAVVARKLRAIVSPLIPLALPRAIYGDLPILARAGTIGGLKRLTKVAAAEGNERARGLGDLFRVDLARTDIPRALQ